MKQTPAGWLEIDNPPDPPAWMCSGAPETIRPRLKQLRHPVAVADILAAHTAYAQLVQFSDLFFANVA